MLLPTLSQEAEMGAGCGTPTRGPWAGLGTCELDWLAMAAGGRRRVASPGKGKGKEGMLTHTSFIENSIEAGNLKYCI